MKKSKMIVNNPVAHSKSKIEREKVNFCSHYIKKKEMTDLVLTHDLGEIDSYFPAVHQRFCKTKTVE